MNGQGSGRQPTDLEPSAGATDPDVAAAEARVAEGRERVARSMLALRQEVRRRMDWRAWVNDKPLAVLGTAFGLGLLFGWRSGGRTRGR